MNKISSESDFGMNEKIKLLMTFTWNQKIAIPMVRMWY